MSSKNSAKLDRRRYLVVRVLRQTPATVFPAALGFALPFASAGAHVSIFYNRVNALAQTVNTASYIVLGSAIAHEIGHVLLGSSEHTSGGLMQGRWNRESWRLASAGLLAFQRDEAQKMAERLWKLQASYPPAKH